MFLAKFTAGREGVFCASFRNSLGRESMQLPNNADVVKIIISVLNGLCQQLNGELMYCTCLSTTFERINSMRID